MGVEVFHEMMVSLLEKSLLVSHKKQLFSFAGDAKVGVKHLWT